MRETRLKGARIVTSSVIYKWNDFTDVCIHVFFCRRRNGIIRIGQYESMEWHITMDTWKEGKQD